MSSLRYLNMILTVLCVLVALELATSWTGWGVPATPVLAQSVPTVPVSPTFDAAGQRKDMIDLLKHMAQQNDDLAAFFKSGELRAHIEMTPKN